jgi:hypothetical protein
MNAPARNANAAFHALQGAARTVRPTSIDLTRSVRDFADQDAWRMAALGRVGSRLAGAGFGGSSYAQFIDHDDFKVLKEFMAHAEADFALADFTVPDTKVDQPFSRDESHHRDREKL